MAITKPSVIDVWAKDASGSPDIEIPAYIDGGFPAPGGVPVVPPRGYFNWLFNYLFNAVRYYCISGFPEWDPTETAYRAGAAVRAPDGNYYVLLGTATTGTAPQADQSNWYLIQWRNRPLKSAWIFPTAAWMNALGQRRALISHAGFLEGKVLAWQERWDDAGMMTAKTGPDFGGWAGRWRYAISGDPAGGFIGGGDAGAAAPMFGGGPGSPSAIRTSNVYLATNPAGTALSCQELETAAQIVIDDDTCLTLQLDASVLLSSAGTPVDDNFAGIVVGSLLGPASGTFAAAGLPGVGFISGSGATWKVYLRAAGASGATFVDTTIPVSGRQRFRIEYYGANVSDTGVATVLLYINSAPVATSPITFNLTGAAPLGPTTARVVLRHADAASLTWLNVQTLDFHANTWPGDIPF